MPPRDNMADFRIVLLMDRYLEKADSDWKLPLNGP